MSGGENGKIYATPPQSSLATTSTMVKRELLINGGVALPKLTSLTPARDLTLGGRGGSLGSANKKVFAPNLNVVRNKNANVKTSKDTTSRGRGRGKSERGLPGRGGSSARGGRGGANTTLIQTTGVFSEGVGAANVRKASSSSSYSRITDDAGISAMRKPTIIKGANLKIDLKEEEKLERELVGEPDVDDFGDDKTDVEHIPIKLTDAKWFCDAPKIKPENPFIDGIATNNAELKSYAAQNPQTSHMKQQPKTRIHGNTPRYTKSVEELFDSTGQQIFVIQMPDTLPCIDDDADNDSPEQMSSNMTSDTPAIQPSKKTNALHDGMDEGQVGKLLRYKSGRIKLVLGESYFDLNMGMETGFLQDLMSISTNREERSGNMINLGPIQAKLTATPDWEYLLKQEMLNEHA